jgi:S-DNA-T family DNA segregation ATPase FtsK/SpoIIIE
MPSNRSKNAAKKPKQTKSAAAAAAQTEPVIKASALHDIGGVVLLVIAVAMAISLISPSSAVVAAGANKALTYGFGTGAMLVPLALAAYAVTFFLPTTGPISARAAIGLTLIVISILAILSITYPGVEDMPNAVLSIEVASQTGGFVGGALAWVLLKLVGRVIGLVVLAGLIITGIIICGFSISGLAARISEAAGERAEALAQQRETSRAEARARKEAKRAQREAEAAAFTPIAEPETSFIGNRKTSVLKRSAQADAKAEGRGKKHPPLDTFVEDSDARHDIPVEDEGFAEPMTTVLPKKSKRARKAAEPATTVLPKTEPATTVLNRDEAVDWQSKLDVITSEEAADDWQAKLDIVTSEEADEARKAVPDFIAAATPKVKAPEPAPVPAPALEVKGERAAVEKAPAANQITRPGDESETLELPPMSILKSNPGASASSSSDEELNATAQRLQATLVEFGLTSKVVGWTAGPLVTTFKIEMGEGERVNKITNLEDDIALSLAAERVRIFAPIPGTSLVGIEIPNQKRQNVALGDVLPHAKGGPLELAIGRDVEGKPFVQDLARMPHLLIAGATGSGKSVMINSIIMSILMRATPDQVRLIMIDPKRVELGGYNGLPHLYVPVVTEPRQANSALQWAVSEMDRRLKVFERAHARDIGAYNKMIEEGKLGEGEDAPDHMPYLVVIIDELSDLMMVAGKEIEASIVRIAQLARAAGIHLIVATQRPSADVVTGLIKSNIETRIAFSVASGTDSRVILDQTGAERLLGRGDMLFRGTGKRVKRVLGAYVSDPEIEEAVDFIRSQAEPDYHDEILSAVVPATPGGGGGMFGDPDDEDDPLIWEAAQIIVDSQLGSTSGLQRRLKVGYARAGRIMDMLQEKGVVGPPDGSRPREVLLDADGLEELKAAEARYREV